MSRIEVFDRNRPLLFSIAYRMLGSVMEALLALLSNDVTLYSDGGGKAQAALKPIYGADRVARFLSGILRKAPPDFSVRQTQVNGRPGLVGYFADGSPQSVVTLEVGEGSVTAIRLVVNPEKLVNVPPLGQTGSGEGSV
jgi:RNA polymerase sigma-70 factor (ECF subfamily)